MCSKEKGIGYHKVNSLLKDYPSPIYCSLLGYSKTNKKVVVLDGHQIIIRRDYKSLKGKVKVIAGGGAGIEPGEAYYVGKGMLTAAVVGEMFTSPSAEEILVAIRELAYENTDGILLIVKNYTGDRLNFGLALEKASCENINIRMLVVGDNIAESTGRIQERKGLAGCLLVYKIAGEMAEQEKTLEEIVKECRENILTDVVTISMTFPPFSTNAFNSLDIEFDEMIFGVGAYGQQGNKKLKVNGLVDAVSKALSEVVTRFKGPYELSQNTFVVLINNLGTISKTEEGVIAMEALKQLNEQGVTVALMYAGTFMSSLNSRGFSITLLKLNAPSILKYLVAPTLAPAWPKNQTMSANDIGKPFNFNSLNTEQPACKHEYLNKARYEDMSFGPLISEKATAAFKQIALFAAEAIISCERQLNVIDSEAGDGDTGTVLKRGADALKEGLINNKLDLTRPCKFLFDLSELCSKNMAGLSGALYSVMFSSAAVVLQNAQEITPELCCEALKAAIKAIKHYGKAQIGDRTMLDVLNPTVDTFESAIMGGKNLTESVCLAAATSELKAEETKQMKPLWWQELGIQRTPMYADAGAHAVAIWLRAVSEGLKLTYPPEY